MPLRAHVCAQVPHGCPCIQVQRWVLGEQHLGRGLGMGVKYVQSHVGYIQAFWGFGVSWCEPLVPASLGQCWVWLVEGVAFPGASPSD